MSVNDWYVDCLDDYVKKLIDTDPIFRRIFQENFQMTNLPFDEQQAAEQIFQKEFPNGVYDQSTLVDFLNYWKIQQNSSGSSSLELKEYGINVEAPLFDSKLKRVIHTKIFPPAKRGRGRPEEFDVFKFILRKTQSHEVYPLQLNLYMDDDVTLDMSFEERKLMENKADQALREVAKIVETLNQLNNYKVMELASEKRILY